MTGLDLETFLRLLRIDLAAWLSLAAALVVIALMTWTSWGSRRVLRKCLVFSLVIHCGLVVYGGTTSILRIAIRPGERPDARRDRIKKIQVLPLLERGGANSAATGSGANGRGSSAFDRLGGKLALNDSPLSVPRPDVPQTELTRPQAVLAPVATPVRDVDVPAPRPPDARAEAADPKEAAAPPMRVAPVEAGDVAPAAVVRIQPNGPDQRPLVSPDVRLRPERSASRRTGDDGARERGSRIDRPTAVAPATAPAPAPEARSDAMPGPAPARGANGDSAPNVAQGDPSSSGVSGAVVARGMAARAPEGLPEADLRQSTRPARSENERSVGRRPSTTETAPVALSGIIPETVSASPEPRGGLGGRLLSDVPEVYRPRLDPNRSALAQRAGASPASEQAVERALDWLMRHQDADGRWDGATAQQDDGTPKPGDDDFTIHCPPGDTCFGPCFYFDADTAMTGLALLAYLGAGYTHTDGKYAETVGRGIDFLLSEQKPDGDLRGTTSGVGMYCQAIATLSLCEAYALTSDARLRKPVERAIGFLVRARARDGLSWRYEPGALEGDTSILGWVVLSIKSARVVGISVPATIPQGALRWLDRVATGDQKGLARYRPEKPPTETMTAEAWVCRQFLGTGGPGLSSTEAAEYLLDHGPDQGPFNLYYLYYGTLAMYQHGGDPWYRWNALSRDLIVKRQHTQGHKAGSWDPDESEWGKYGGRIYTTALATLSLEVYYRFLRLYDDPRIPPGLTPRPNDGELRRTGGDDRQ
jgi:hypothetical protein